MATLIETREQTINISQKEIFDLILEKCKKEFPSIDFKEAYVTIPSVPYQRSARAEVRVSYTKESSYEEE